jgi:hypothetical protein
MNCKVEKTPTGARIVCGTFRDTAVEEAQRLIAELKEKYPPLPPGPWLVSAWFMGAVKSKALKSEHPSAWNHIGGIALHVDERVPEGSRVPWYLSDAGELLPVPLR